eukprot:CAMPEP_0172700240 /NCGR_PEP_ID=MMETSP1074-20121228/30766_1 /TAXON_ID=2916 /ORGANISM="Ceratium fusus, Strain PA161109" /LENGTH=40 /DNA_ID= /DNA_START= /DNA_END= /DNA_ORIENTATION=
MGKKNASRNLTGLSMPVLARFLGSCCCVCCLSELAADPWA